MKCRNCKRQPGSAAAAPGGQADPAVKGKWNVRVSGGIYSGSSHEPCPCGYYPDMNKCRCTPGEVSHYLHKLSQPLLERIDLCADVPPVNFSQISGEKSGESSALIRKRVEKARRIQQKRYQNEKICFNGELSGKQIRKYCVLTENAFQVAKNAFELMELSARSYHRILKVSRTIADMEGEELIHTRHVAEALTYKAFDKKYRS